MALQPCGECGREVSTKAGACPHCGAPIEPQVWCTGCGAQIPSGRSKCPSCGKPVSGRAPAAGVPISSGSSGRAGEVNKMARGCGLGCLGLIAFAIIIGLLDDGESKPASFQDKQLMAGRVCEKYVRASLKAPSTADFGDKQTVSLGDDSFQVVGQVDAQNSFGAMIRNTYTCKTRFGGGVGDAVYSNANWTLEDISIADR